MAGSRPGPARSESARAGILTAAAHELAENGYDRFSLDRVARAAGSSKQTIYRWYASKSALIAECVTLGYIVTPALPLAETDDVRADLAAWIRGFGRSVSDPALAAQLRATTAAAAESTAIATEYDSSVVASTQNALVQRLQRGVAAGQLTSDAPLETMAHTVIGALLLRVLLRQPVDEAFAAELEEVLFDSTATAAAPRRDAVHS